jgi:DNA primase
MDIQAEVQDIARKFLRKVKRSGPDDIMAICPFHLNADGTEENRASFAMSLSTGLYFCHACKSKGNLFSFLKNIGLTVDIIERQYRFLIDSASSNLPPPPDPLRPKVFAMPEVNEAVLGLFDYCPTELINDGFFESTLRHFEVGYDKWYGRVTYPLRDLKGKLVGVMGRNPDGFTPKYKVYTREYPTWGLPEVVEPDKRCVMWNADKVYPLLYFGHNPNEPVVVVEGFKACMWVWQAGIRNVVALLGSYLSWEHRWMLERIGAPVYLFLDNNAAGRTGQVSAAELLGKSLNVGIVQYPNRLAEDEDAQPDSCTMEEVQEAMTRVPSYLNYLLTLAQ